MRDDDRVKATWEQPGKGRSVVSVVMYEPRTRQCNRSCPWRVSNHGKTIPFEYDHEVANVPTDTHCHYTPERAALWWDHLKTGRYGDWRNLCHVMRKGTWDHMLTNRLTGITRWHMVACQCTGGLVLQQRELLRHVENGRSALTAEGAARVASDMLGREVGEHDVAVLDVSELLQHAHPALLDPQISSPHLASLSDRELRDWRAADGSAVR
jgi:hypothetical protein